MRLFPDGCRGEWSCEFVTPAFFSKEEIDGGGPLPRPSEVRGQLRWAFRTFAASLYGPDTLRRVETELWGGPDGDEVQPSPVSVEVSPVDRREPMGEHVDGGNDVKISSEGYPELRKWFYLCPGEFVRDSVAIPAGEAFSIRARSVCGDALEVFEGTLRLTSLLYGFGRRFRRGFGSFRLLDGSDFPENPRELKDKLEGILENLREQVVEGFPGVDPDGSVGTFPRLNEAKLWVAEVKGDLENVLRALSCTLLYLRQACRRGKRLNPCICKGLELEIFRKIIDIKKDEKAEGRGRRGRRRVRERKCEEKAGKGYVEIGGRLVRKKAFLGFAGPVKEVSRIPGIERLASPLVFSVGGMGPGSYLVTVTLLKFEEVARQKERNVPWDDLRTAVDWAFRVVFEEGGGERRECEDLDMNVRELGEYEVKVDADGVEVSPDC